MKGFIKQTATGICFSAGLFTIMGCYHYREIVDPCWPERYNAIAAHSVRDMQIAQADKGHILNQTLWNEDFDGDKIKPSGIARLKWIAGREPTPVLMKVYLQNADVPLDADTAKYIREQERANDGRRKAMQAFLSTQTAARNGTVYQIDVHDYVQPSYPANWTQNALDKVELNTKTGILQNFASPSVNK